MQLKRALRWFDSPALLLPSSTFHLPLFIHLLLSISDTPPPIELPKNSRFQSSTLPASNWVPKMCSTFYFISTEMANLHVPSSPSLLPRPLQNLDSTPRIGTHMEPRFGSSHLLLDSLCQIYFGNMIVHGAPS